MSPARLRTRLLFLACLPLSLGALSAKEPGPGTVELGGNASFQTISQNGEDGGYLLLQPLADIRITPWLFAGPYFGYAKVWDEEISDSRTLFGGRIGAIYPAKWALLPYAGFSVGFLLFTSLNGYISSAQPGQVSTVFAGLKIRLTSGFFLNLESEYTYSEYGLANQEIFGLKVGFSGIPDF